MHANLLLVSWGNAWKNILKGQWKGDARQRLYIIICKRIELIKAYNLFGRVIIRIWDACAEKIFAKLSNLRNK